MEITWYGHSCFRITERGRVTTVTDPYSSAIGLEPPRLKGDIVTISHDSPGHHYAEAVKGAQHILRGAGEYEISEVFITGIAMTNTRMTPIRSNVSYFINYETLTVLHLGDLMDVPDQAFVQALGEVTVLLVPVGGGNGLNANKAAEVVALLEPHYVVPMHYALPGLRVELEPVDKFLKAMGVGKAIEADVLKISANELPEQTQVVTLTPNLTGVSA